MVTEAEWNAIPVGSQLLLRLRGAEQKVLVRAAYEAALLCQGFVSWEKSNDFDGYVGDAGGFLWYGIRPDVRTKRLAMELVRAPWPEHAECETCALRSAASACLASYEFGSSKTSAGMALQRAWCAVGYAERAIAESLCSPSRGYASALAEALHRTASAIRAAIPWDLVDDAQMRAKR